MLYSGDAIDLRISIRATLIHVKHSISPIRMSMCVCVRVCKLKPVRILIGAFAR